MFNFGKDSRFTSVPRCTHSSYLRTRPSTLDLWDTLRRVLSSGDRYPDGSPGVSEKTHYETRLVSTENRDFKFRVAIFTYSNLSKKVAKSLNLKGTIVRPLYFKVIRVKFIESQRSIERGGPLVVRGLC